MVEAVSGRLLNLKRQFACSEEKMAAVLLGEGAEN